jgi:hypothetical protein
VLITVAVQYFYSAEILFPMSTIRNGLIVTDSGIPTLLLLELWFETIRVAESTTTSGVVSVFFLLYELDYMRRVHEVVISRVEAHGRGCVQIHCPA